MCRLGAGFLLCAIVACCGQSTAQPYVSVFGGVGFREVDADTAYGVAIEEFQFWRFPFLIEELDTSLVPTEESLGAGFVAGGALGYQFAAPFPGDFRVELEGSHRGSDKGAAVAPLQCDPEFSLLQPFCFYENAREVYPEFDYTHVGITAGMANFVYASPPLAGRLSVYVGGGAGIARLNFRRLTLENFELVDGIFIGVYEDTDRSEAAFAWQAFGGVSTAVADDLDLYVEGRFFRSSSSEVYQLGPDPVEVESDLSVSDAAVLVGLRFAFH